MQFTRAPFIVDRVGDAKGDRMLVDRVRGRGIAPHVPLELMIIQVVARRFGSTGDRVGR